jgi:hypothetical protein
MKRDAAGGNVDLVDAWPLGTGFRRDDEGRRLNRHQDVVARIAENT